MYTITFTTETALYIIQTALYTALYPDRDHTKLHQIWYNTLEPTQRPGGPNQRINFGGSAVVIDETMPPLMNVDIAGKTMIQILTCLYVAIYYDYWMFWERGLLRNPIYGLVAQFSKWSDCVGCKVLIALDNSLCRTVFIFMDSFCWHAVITDWEGPGCQLLPDSYFCYVDISEKSHSFNPSRNCLKNLFSKKFIEVNHHRICYPH